MTAERPPTNPDETADTVQLLVADAGNRSAISGMLDGQFDVETSQTLTDADLYLVEDHRFPDYQAELRERIDRAHPAFCPIVLIRREGTNVSLGSTDPATADGSVRIDEVVDAPIDPPLLIRRLNSLLVRRRQSKELMEQVSTLEEQEQRLRHFESGIESTGNGILMTDSTGTIEYVNPALEAMAGYTEADALGESPQLLLPEGTGEVFDAEFWRTMTDQGEWEGDIVIERKDSQRLVVNATATTLRDAKQETEGFVIVLSDITERIQRKQELEDREEELDLLRQILTRYLRHNLRNDLNVILGNAELLKGDETLSPAQTEWVETIVENAEQLIEKSDTARTYSTLLEREAELSPFDLSEVTRKAVRTVRKDHSDVNFEIDVPETCEIRAREGIQRAFEELIDNAARYNDATDPWVRVRVRERDGARLLIEDNGPGIPDQEQAALNRGTETQLSHSQGIGLWLSKWLIDGLDGRLSIETTDTGTRVDVVLPPAEDVGSSGLEVTTLKERERRLQTITDRMTDAILEVDPDWNISLLDERAEGILEVDAEEAVGQRFWDVIPDIRETEFESAVRDAMDSRTSRSVEEYFAGIDAWLEVNVYPEFDGGLSFYTRDVTERNERERHLQERVKELSAIHATTDLFQTSDAPLEKVLSVFVKRISQSFQYPDIAEARLRYDDIDVSTADFESIDQRLRAHADLEDGSEIELAVGYQPDSKIDAEDPFLDEEAELLETLVTVARNHVQRRTHLRALERTEELLTNAERLGDVGAWEVDLETPDVFWTKGAKRIHGVSEEFEPTPEEAMNFVHPGDRETVNEAFVACAESGDPFTLEARIQTPEGEERWVHLQGQPLETEAGKKARGYIRDITEQKERKSQLQRYGFAFESVLSGIAIANLDGELTDVNPAVLDMWGYDDKDEVLGRPVREFWKTDEKSATVMETIKEQGRWEGEREAVRADGSTFYTRSSASLLKDGEGTPIGIMASFVDITERKERERQMTEMKERYQTLLEAAPDPVFLADVETGEILETNVAAESLLGESREAIIGRNQRTLHPPEDADLYRRAFESHESQETVRRLSDGSRPELVTAEGETVPIEISATTISLPDGPVKFAIFRDVSEQIERGRELERTNAFLSTLFETIPAGVTVLDDEGNIIQANSYAEAQLGLVASEITDRTYRDPEWEIFDENGESIAPEDLPFAKVMESGTMVTDYEHGIELSDGSKRWLSINAAPIVGPDGKIAKVVAVITDITEKRDISANLAEKTDRSQ